MAKIGEQIVMDIVEPSWCRDNKEAAGGVEQYRLHYFIIIIINIIIIIIIIISSEPTW